uniref:3'-5' exonuclease domain-containing protein n=1 Tax=Rhodosorus marinus TaxID=101924 RepID=A0A7S2ZJZ0_9RHOD
MWYSGNVVDGKEVKRGDYIELDADVEVVWVGSGAEQGDELTSFEGTVERSCIEGADVGLDVEWKPVRAAEKPYCSVLQVGFEHRVFLLDLLVSADHGNRRFWRRLNEALGALFQCRRVRKLGYGFVDDLARLRASHPLELPCTLRGIQGLIEINILHRLGFGFEQKNRHLILGLGTGLSGAAQATLGLPLDKSMQVSDWAQRPLTSEQVQYASIDAWVLVRIAKEICPPRHQSRLKWAMDLDEQGTTLPIGLKGFEEESRVVLETGGPGEGEEIGKSIALIVQEKRPVLVVTTGARRVDFGLLSAYYGVDRKSVRMATSRECTELFGHSPGNIGPLGTRFQDLIQVLFDESLRHLPGGEKERIVCSAGKPGYVYRVTPRDLAELCGASWLGSPAWHTQVDIEDRGFVVDNMMQRTARHLRFVGMDTLFPPHDNHAWILSAAKLDRRVILTKTSRLFAKAVKMGLPCYRVMAAKATDQVLEVARIFRIPMGVNQRVARCVKCNNKEFNKFGREGAGSLVTEKELQLHDEFWQCTCCLHVYWKGRHFKNQMSQFEDLGMAVQNLSVR